MDKEVEEEEKEAGGRGGDVLYDPIGPLGMQPMSLFIFCFTGNRSRECLSVCLPGCGVCLSICLCACKFECSSRLPLWLTVYISVCLFICLFPSGLLSYPYNLYACLLFCLPRSFALVNMSVFHPLYLCMSFLLCLFVFVCLLLISSLKLNLPGMST